MNDITLLVVAVAALIGAMLLVGFCGNI